jgi:heme/copper-type cytochrome/quinol oxidase subunit 3
MVLEGCRARAPVTHSTHDIMSTEAHPESTKAPPGTAEFAMKIFMASWTLSFVALISAYVYMRALADLWPPDGAPRPPLKLTTISTVAAVVSSGVLQIGVHRANRGDRSLLAASVGGTAGLGTLFLVLQSLAGVDATARGLVPTLNAYGALFWITAVFHALHVVVGVVALVALWARIRSERAPSSLTLRLWSYYWHGVDLAWLAIYFVMFLPG